MQLDIIPILVANMYVALLWTPWIVVSMTLIRTIILFRGQKREFEEWTRNPLMTFLSALFLPGTLVYIGIRYIVTTISGIKIERVSGSTTYGELDMFLELEKPPSVAVTLISLFVTVVLTVFVALTLLILPFVFLFDFSLILIFWYVAIGVFYNSSIRSGDASLVLSSLRNKPRRGSIELIVVLASIFLLYWQLSGVAV